MCLVRGAKEFTSAVRCKFKTEQNKIKNESNNFPL